MLLAAVSASRVKDMFGQELSGVPSFGLSNEVMELLCSAYQVGEHTRLVQVWALGRAVPEDVSCSHEWEHKGAVLTCCIQVCLCLRGISWPLCWKRCVDASLKLLVSPDKRRWRSRTDVLARYDYPGFGYGASKKAAS